MENHTPKEVNPYAIHFIKSKKSIDYGKKNWSIGKLQYSIINDLYNSCAPSSFSIEDITFLIAKRYICVN